MTDDQIDSLDAVMTLTESRIFNDFFGTGGNIGKRDLESVSNNCMQLIKEEDAQLWLYHTLFGDHASLPDLS